MTWSTRRIGCLNPLRVAHALLLLELSMHCGSLRGLHQTLALTSGEEESLGILQVAGSVTGVATLGSMISW